MLYHGVPIDLGMSLFDDDVGFIEGLEVACLIYASCSTHDSGNHVYGP